MGIVWAILLVFIVVYVTATGHDLPTWLFIATMIALFVALDVIRRRHPLEMDEISDEDAADLYDDDYPEPAPPPQPYRGKHS